MSCKQPLQNKRFMINKYIDALTATALFLVGLIVYSRHLVTLPSGVDGDSVRLGLYAHDLLQENLFPLYVRHQFGPHPLIIYLQALVFTLFGYSVATLRSVTIVGGALAAPAVYWATRWLFEEQGAGFSRRAGLIAALGISLSTNLAFHSRMGIESALLPFVELVVVAFLWRGFRTGGWVNFVLAGLFVGISQYVYIVARFFPIALAVGCLAAWLSNRQLLAHWRSVMLTAFSSALVSLPQWSLFVAYPYTSFARVSNPTGPIGGQSIFELSNPVAVFGGKILNLLLMLFWSWDTSDNPISSYALLTPVLAAGLVVALAVTVRQRRSSQLFALLMMLMMLLPEMLTYIKKDPLAIDTSRVVPALPFVFILAGLGAATTWAWIENNPLLPKRAGYIVLPFVLLSGLFRQWDFETLARSQISKGQSGNEKLELIVDYIGNQDERHVLIPSYQYQLEPLALFLAEHFPLRQGGLDLPVQQGDSIIVVEVGIGPTHTGNGAMADEWVLLKDRTAFFLPPGSDSVQLRTGNVETLVANDGEELARAYEAHWQGMPPDYGPLLARFTNNLNLVGLQTGDLQRGTDLQIMTYWQPAKKIERDVEIFVQLYDVNRDSIVTGIQDWPLNGVYRVRAWKLHQTMPLSYRLPIPSYLNSGPYQLQVGVFDLIAQKRIPLVADGNSQPDTTVNIPLTLSQQVPENFTSVNYADLIGLEGYTLKPAKTGLEIIFFFRALDSISHDYTLFVHIVDGNDRIVAQKDAQPFNGEYPTSKWSLSDLIVEVRTLSPIPEGEYKIYIGWYRHREEGWERLSTVGNGTSPATDHLLLDTITIR